MSPGSQDVHFHILCREMEDIEKNAKKPISERKFTRIWRKTQKIYFKCYKDGSDLVEAFKVATTFAKSKIPA